MARHKQPVELAKLKGAGKRNAQRSTKEPPKSGKPLGKQPDHLEQNAAEVWKELEKCALPGVLTVSARFIMDVTSSFLAEFRAGGAESKQRSISI